MFLNARVFALIPVAAVLLLGSGTARAETTSETNPSSPATVVIVDPLDGAVFDAPASFTVRIESASGSSEVIETVHLEIDGEPVGATCIESGVCNVEVADLAVGAHALVAIAETFGTIVVSDPVSVTVNAGTGTGSESGSESGTSETGAETADPGATGTGEAPTTGDSETAGDSEATGGGDASDDDLVGKGCGCVSGGGSDPLALGLLLLGGALVRRRRA